MTHLPLPRQQQRTDPIRDPRAERQTLLAQLRILGGAEDEGADQVLTLAGHADQLGGAGGNDRRNRGAGPTIGIGE